VNPAARSALFWIGLAVLIVGLASLVVPIPRTHDAEFQAGGVSIGIETEGEEKVSPILSGAMIVAGVVMMITQKVKVSI
jgi:prolipoprotein diacylglyceryltransferase